MIAPMVSAGASATVAVTRWSGSPRENLMRRSAQVPETRKTKHQAKEEQVRPVNLTVIS
jgi:hypothetical protein